MVNLLKILSSGRAGLGMMLLISAGVVGVSMYMTEALRLSPCPLCIFQRLLYLVMAVMAGVALCLPGRRWWALLLLLLGAAGTGTALYQSWLQAFPELAKECSYTDPNLIEQLVDWLGMRYPQFFLATGFCTSKEWVFLGLSIANWSVLIFGFLSALAGRVFVSEARAS